MIYYKYVYLHVELYVNLYNLNTNNTTKYFVYLNWNMQLSIFCALRKLYEHTVTDTMTPTYQFTRHEIAINIGVEFSC